MPTRILGTIVTIVVLSVLFVTVPSPAQGGPAATCDGKAVTMQVPSGGQPFVGTDGNDVILGTPGRDIIKGGPGNDTICGLGGADTIHGDNGADKLIGNQGPDELYGGWGNDRLLGGLGDDRLVGGPNHDRLFGYYGDDLLEGRDGRDVLYGGPEADSLYGGRHDDKHFGGLGTNDSCYGGLGADSFTAACETSFQDPVTAGPTPTPLPTVTPTPLPGNPPPTATPVPEPATPGCGSWTKRGALQRRTLSSDGYSRKVWVYAPTTYSWNSATPVLMAFHALAADGVGVIDWGNLTSLAEQHGFIVVAPTGLPVPNDSAGRLGWELRENLDSSYSDIRFTREALFATLNSMCINTGRIYALGNSAGGYFVSRLVCEMSNFFSGAVMIAAVMWDSGCPPEAKIPVMGIHGSEDKVVPLDGGGSDILPQSIFFSGLFNRSVFEAFRDFAEFNGCLSGPRQELIAVDIKRFTFRQCDEESVFYRIIGGGHTWPGSAASQAASDSAHAIFGSTTFSMDASQQAWAFLSSKERPELITYAQFASQGGSTAQFGPAEYFDLPSARALSPADPVSLAEE